LPGHYLVNFNEWLLIIFMKHLKSILKNGWAWANLIICLMAIVIFYGSRATINHYQNRAAMFENNWKSCEGILNAQ